jgi:hypothetical protein
MLGPVLDEVISWITESQALPPPPMQPADNQNIGGLFGLLAGASHASSPP